MQYFLHLDKRKILLQEYSQPPILPSPHCRWVVNVDLDIRSMSLVINIFVPMLHVPQVKYGLVVGQCYV